MICMNLFSLKYLSALFTSYVQLFPNWFIGKIMSNSLSNLLTDSPVAAEVKVAHKVGDPQEQKETANRTITPVAAVSVNVEG